MTESSQTDKYPNLVRPYDDSIGYPRSSHEKEQAFRQGFVEMARHLVQQWPKPHAKRKRTPTARWCYLRREAREAYALRQRVRERFSVYSTGHGIHRCSCRKTYHMGYRPEHVLPAARLRGRHHALEYLFQPIMDDNTIDITDRKILRAWLKAVEIWNASPIDPDHCVPPPDPLEIDCPDWQQWAQKQVEFFNASQCQAMA